MKKIPVLFFLLMLSIVIQAQSKIDSSKIVIKNKPVINKAIKTKVTQPVSTPNPGSTQTQTTTTTAGEATSTPIQKTTVTTTTATAPKTDNDYFLSVVKVTIKTGSDNKEYPSQLDIYISPGNENPRNSTGFSLFGYKNELKVNSAIDLFLEKKPTSTDPAKNTLAAYKQYGFRFSIYYGANIVLDAWKIESLSVTLEFKDANNNSHPTMGQKKITFTDANLWMDGYDKKVSYYKTDTYFNPLPVKQGPDYSITNY